MMDKLHTRRQNTRRKHDRSVLRQRRRNKKFYGNWSYVVWNYSRVFHVIRCQFDNITLCFEDCNATHFSARTFWCPPGFSIPQVLKNKFTGDPFPLSSLSSASIPYHEQFSGYINEETIEKVLMVDITNYVKKLETKDDFMEKRMLFYCGRQELKRKDVSDVMEALLGVYLETCGIGGAFKVLKYFGILNNENLDELIREIRSPAEPCPVVTLRTLLPGYESIEKLCGYQFKKKSYLLQAFTHPSFRNNYVTECYQRLEFLGDAVLDFLITSYIYEYCDDLTPGQLTDLRSSLVNNNTFGALAVRLQLHRHLLCHSQRLLEAIQTFVLYQEGKNYEIHGNELMILINEDDTTVAEEVDIPKVLGDIFESLAGAVFLDSGCDLSVVWNLYYNIMKEEIDKFSRNIPINPVRALYERVPTKVIFDSIQSKISQDMKTGKQKMKVLLKITHKKQSRQYVGRGNNIKTAKRAAAKYALRDLDYNEFVI